MSLALLQTAEQRREPGTGACVNFQGRGGEFISPPTPSWVPPGNAKPAKSPRTGAAAPGKFAQPDVLR
jgi:hypothetical protein